MNEHIIDFQKEKLKMMKQIEENKMNYDPLSIITNDKNLKNRFKKPHVIDPNQVKILKD
jgi:hypothetical protein